MTACMRPEEMRVTASAGAMTLAIQEEYRDTMMKEKNCARPQMAITSPLRIAFVEERAELAAALAAEEAASAASFAASELSRTEVHTHPLPKWANRSTHGNWERLRIVRRVVEEGHTPETLAAGRPLLPKPAMFPQTFTESVQFSRPQCRGPRHTWKGAQKNGHTQSAPTLSEPRISASPILAALGRNGSSSSVSNFTSVPPCAHTSPTATRAAAAAAAAAAVLQQPPKGSVAPKCPLAEVGWTMNLKDEPLMLDLAKSPSPPKKALPPATKFKVQRTRSKDSQCTIWSQIASDDCNDADEWSSTCAESSADVSTAEQSSLADNSLTLSATESKKRGSFLSRQSSLSMSALDTIGEAGGADFISSPCGSSVDSSARARPRMVFGEGHPLAAATPQQQPHALLRHCWDRSRALLRHSSAEAFAGGPCVR